MEIFTSKSTTPDLYWRHACLLPPEIDIESLPISDYMCDSLGGFHCDSNWRLNGFGYHSGALTSVYGRPCTSFINAAGTRVYVPKFEKEMFGLYPDTEREAEFAAGTIALSRSIRTGVGSVGADAYKYVTYDPDILHDYKGFKIFISTSFPQGIKILKKSDFHITLVGKAADQFPHVRAFVLNKKGGSWDNDEDVSYLGQSNGSNATAHTFSIPENTQCWGIRLTCNLTTKMNRGVWALYFPNTGETELIEPIPDLPADLQLVSTYAESGYSRQVFVPVTLGSYGYVYASIPVSVGVKKPDTYFIPTATAYKAPLVMSNIQAAYNNGCAKLEIEK